MYTHKTPPPVASRRVEHSRRIASHRMRTNKRHSNPSNRRGKLLCRPKSQNLTHISNHTPSKSTPPHAGCLSFRCKKVKKNVVSRNDDVDRSIDGSMDRSIDGWMDGWMARSCIFRCNLVPVEVGTHPVQRERRVLLMSCTTLYDTFSTALRAVRRRPQWE